MCSTSRFFRSVCRGVTSGLQLLRSVNYSDSHGFIERHRGFGTGQVIRAGEAFGTGKAIGTGKTTGLGKEIRVDKVVDSNGRQNRPLCVTLIEGLGSGPTICAAVREIFKAAGVWVQWDRRTMHVHRNPYTDRLAVNADLVHSAMETGLVLRGPVSDSTQSSAVLTLHKTLDAFVSVRLFASVEGYQPFGRVRIVNIRDNVSGEYSEIEHTVVPGKLLYFVVGSL